MRFKPHEKILPSLGSEDIQSALKDSELLQNSSNSILQRATKITWEKVEEENKFKEGSSEKIEEIIKIDPQEV